MLMVSAWPDNALAVQKLHGDFYIRRMHATGITMPRMTLELDIGGPGEIKNAKRKAETLAFP
jgi:hypothetical protein